MAAGSLRDKRGASDSDEGIILAHSSILPASFLTQDIGSPSQGEGGLTVPGFIGVIGSESSPVPSGGEPTLSSPATENLSDIPGKAYLKFLRLHYLDYEATSPYRFVPQAQKLFGRMCGSLALWGEDEDGNRIAKRIPCGREWCQDCRDISHKRRIARVLTRLMQVYPMAYDVSLSPSSFVPSCVTPWLSPRSQKKYVAFIVGRGFLRSTPGGISLEIKAISTTLI
ncbi:hypothetical protein ES703_109249 [subsurface metagenome]